MSLPPIPYNFHDSLILGATLEYSELSLNVQLYSSYYPDAPMVTVHFRDVFNVETVAAYMDRMREGADSESNLATIYRLTLDEKKVSTKNDAIVFLQTEVGHIRIHCRAVDVI